MWIFTKFVWDDYITGINNAQCNHFECRYFALFILYIIVL